MFRCNGLCPRAPRGPRGDSLASAPFSPFSGGSGPPPGGASPGGAPPGGARLWMFPRHIACADWWVGSRRTGTVMLSTYVTNRSAYLQSHQIKSNRTKGHGVGRSRAKRSSMCSSPRPPHPSDTLPTPFHGTHHWMSYTTLHSTYLAPLTELISAQSYLVNLI